MKYIKETQTSNLRILLRSDNIIETRTLGGWCGKSTLEHAKENMKAIEEFTGDTLYPMMNFLSSEELEKDAIEFYSNHEPMAVASAMIGKSLLARLVGNMFLKFFKLNIPTKLFADEEKALKWLSKFEPQPRKKVEKEEVTS